MTGMGRYIAATLAVLGTVALTVASMSWSSCWGTPTADACLAASDANVGMTAAAVLWLVAVLVAGLGLFAASSRAGSALAVALLVVVNPITDPGFFWAFDSADATPGRGVIGALAILASAVIVTIAGRARAGNAVTPRVVEAA